VDDGHLAVRAAFAEVAWLPGPEAAQILEACRQLWPLITEQGVGASFERFADHLASSLGRAPADGRLALDKPFALDVVADTLKIAGSLHVEGRHAAAFGLEGIVGRLMEALLASAGGPENSEHPAMGSPAASPGAVRPPGKVVGTRGGWRCRRRHRF
jgi:hypothetical protein